MNKKVKLIGLTSAVLAGVLISTSYLSAHPMGMYDYAPPGRQMMHKSGFETYDYGSPGCHMKYKPGFEMHDYAPSSRHMKRKPGFDMPRHGGMLKAVWQIDLSNEQREQIGDLMVQKREVSRGQMAAKREARKNLHQAMLAEPYDAERVQQLAEAQGAALTKRVLKRAQAGRQIISLLTPEQRIELVNLQSQRKRKDTCN